MVLRSTGAQSIRFIETPREQRFWRKYYDARNAFLQDVADVTGDTIEVAGADGTTIIEPSHHTKH
jgi:hypothetical protein